MKNIPHIFLSQLEPFLDTKPKFFIHSKLKKPFNTKHLLLFLPLHKHDLKRKKQCA